MATKKAKVKAPPVIMESFNDRVEEVLKGVHTEIDKLLSSIRKELTSLVSVLNKKGSASKIAVFLKSEIIVGLAGVDNACPIANYLETKLVEKFGKIVSHNMLEVCSDEITVDTVHYSTSLGDDLGNRITVKTPKNVAQFIEKFDDGDGDPVFAALRA